MKYYDEIFRGKLPDPGEFPACYAFSLHKAGSTMMYKMIGAVCRAENIPAVSIPDVLFKEGVLDSDWRSDASLVECFSDGRLYFGFRYFPEVLLDRALELQNKKSVLLVRDPRDALVSEYFSYGGYGISHAVPEKNREAFIAQFSARKGVEIDRYVVEAARGYKNKIVGYLANLNPDLTKIFRYEEVYFDKERFLADIFEHFALPVSAGTIRQVAKQNDIRPEQEDPTQHIRKGAPGDHVIKLKPETIKVLNDIFRDAYAPYGYDLC